MLWPVVLKKPVLTQAFLLYQDRKCELKLPAMV